MERKRRGPRPLADVLVSALPQLGDRMLAHRLRRSWVALVGADMARRSMPRELVNGCLHVAVDNSPWLSELTLRAEELRVRLAAEFPAVRSLRFMLGVVEPEPRMSGERRERRAVPLSAEARRQIDETAAVISDPALADAARRLLVTAWRFPVARGTDS